MDFRAELEQERERSAELLGREEASRLRAEAEAAATRAAVEEAIKDLEALDADRTELRARLQVRCAHGARVPM